MAVPSTGAGKSGFLCDANTLSSSAKLQHTNHIHNSTILNRWQPLHTGTPLNQIVQKLPNAILSTHKINPQQIDKSSGTNIISYRLTQKNSMSAGPAAQKLNVFQRSGNNVKLINGYGVPQIHETSVNNDSETLSKCSPVQEISIPLQVRLSPNVTASWLRQIADGDIVYVR